MEGPDLLGPDPRQSHHLDQSRRDLPAELLQVRERPGGDQRRDLVPQRLPDPAVVGEPVRGDHLLEVGVELADGPGAVPVGRHPEGVLALEFEQGADLVELLDTGLDPVSVVAAAPEGLLHDGLLPPRPLVVASELERIATDWIRRRGLRATLVRSYGATEVFPPEDADVIVDVMDTGETLAANGLVVVDVLMTSSTRLYASRRAVETAAKKAAIDGLVLSLRSVLEARGRAMVRTFGLTHIALAVQDAERAYGFYRDVFGMVAVYRGEGFVQAQTPGSRDVLVLEESERAAGSGGIAHFGFRLVDQRDIDAAAQAVECAGGEILDRGEFCPGEPYLFCRDLDGYDLEIWHELPTSVDSAQEAREGRGGARTAPLVG